MENIAKGDSDEFCVDRALFELRRGRAIGIIDGDDCISVASVETLKTATLQGFKQTGRALVLFLTSTRANVLGLAPKDGASPGLELPHRIDLGTLKTLAGIDPSDLPTNPRSFTTQPSSRAAAAGLRLAKKAR